MTITEEQSTALRTKYSRFSRQHDIQLSEARADIQPLLEVSPSSVLSAKYAANKPDHKMPFWIARDDINGVLDAIHPGEIVEEIDKAVIEQGSES